MTSLAKRYMLSLLPPSVLALVYRLLAKPRHIEVTASRTDRPPSKDKGRNHSMSSATSHSDYCLLTSPSTSAPSPPSSYTDTVLDSPNSTSASSVDPAEDDMWEGMSDAEIVALHVEVLLGMDVTLDSGERDGVLLP